METFCLDAALNKEIDGLVEEIACGTTTIEDAAVQQRAAGLAHELPRALREALLDFRLNEPSAGFLISGVEIDDGAIGPTPAHWHPPAGVSPALREEIVFSLCAQLLGDPFGYATLQNGLLMHNIIPIAGHEREQISTGSATVLAWHTEEAFHPYRADYTALMCLRNPYRAPTTFVDAADLEITAADREILAQPRFRTRPSGSHASARNTYVTRLAPPERARSAASFRHIEALHRDPRPQRVLSGSPDRPYLCVDPDCMTADGAAAEGALGRLCAEIDRKLADVALAPGDILFMDNHRAVHGRKPFTARFDGTDRWLKRMNVTRDLRRTRALRMSAAGRIVYY